jgi:translation initiation factor IF-2
MSKRANEIAKELGIPNNELVALINERFPQLGVKSHSNTVSEFYLEEVLAYVRQRLDEIPPEAPPAARPGASAAVTAAAAVGKARRANEIAKELGLTNNELVAAVNEAFPDLGVKSHSNTIPGPRLKEVTDYLCKKFGVKPAPPQPASATAPAKPAPSAKAAPAAGANAGAAGAANTAAARAGSPARPGSPPHASAASPKSPAPPPPAAKVPPPANAKLPPAARPAPSGKTPPTAPAAGHAAAAGAAHAARAGSPRPGSPPPASAASPKSPLPPPPAAKVPPPPPGKVPPPAKLPPPAKIAPPAAPAAKAPPPVARPVTQVRPGAPVPASAASPKSPLPPPPAARVRPPAAKVPPAPAPAAKLPPPGPKLPPSIKAPPPVVKMPQPPPRIKSPGALPGRAAAGAPPALPGTAFAAGQSAAGAAAPGDPAAPPPPAAPEFTSTLTIRPPIVVRDFAIALNLRPFRLISELMEMGIFASIGQSIDETVAVRIAKKHSIALEVKHRGEAAPVKPVPVAVNHDDPALLEPRPPVVCVLGHVDHGKTTLLDYYRKTSVVSGEAGGITQHVGAYSVEHDGKRITFLDTPGHAAFSKMRERGAEITDIAILVVAADDGFMPQTDEALKFAQKNNVQIVVAINKMDARGANLDRVKQQMQQRGIASEDWGGTVLTNPVSALVGTGMDNLLESVLLQSEMMEIRANPKRPAEGTVVEAQMEVGRGPTAAIIVQKGTLKPGDAIVCGRHYCKVRALFDDRGKPLKNVPPGNPALVLGWNGVPTPGAVFQTCKNEKEARARAEENEHNLRKALEEEADVARAEKSKQLTRLSDMDRLMAAIAQTKDKVLKVLCKADVNGTLEALIACLEGIHSDKVKLEVVASSVGPITPSDVNIAQAGGATIVAFDVKQENGVPALLKRGGVRVITHDIIYMLIDLVKETMTTLLDPVYRENKVGMAEIRAIFPHGKNSFAAGCMVTEGRVQRDFKARLHRGKQIVHESVIDTLKRFKDDATEVKAGYECGIRLDGCDDYKENDLIECYEILEERPTL